MQPPAYRAEAEDGGLVGEKRKRKEKGENVKKTRRKGKEKKRDWSITSLRYIGTSLQCVWCARNHACTHGCTPSRTHARTHAPHFLRCDKVVFFSSFSSLYLFLCSFPDWQRNRPRHGTLCFPYRYPGRPAGLGGA